MARSDRLQAGGDRWTRVETPSTGARKSAPRDRLVDGRSGLCAVARPARRSRCGWAVIVAGALGRMAVFAEQIAPYSLRRDDPGARSRPPEARSWLGTDNVCRDMFSRIVYGARVSITVGFATVAWRPCWPPPSASRAATSAESTIWWFSGSSTRGSRFPYLVIILSVMAVLGPGLFNVVLSLAIIVAAANSRVIRGATIAVAENPYVEAARAVGCGHLRIIVRHILPNVAATIIILATIGLGTVILAESALSFLGFGVPPPYPAWGAMLSGSGRTYMFRAPWMAIWPGVAISLAVFGFNMLGDALRDVLDPRLRGGAR